jgi:hypothetical protein
MTIRFAAAQSGDRGFVTRFIASSVPLRAANDNDWNLARDRVVQGALRHFARHGLAAAQVAQDNAEDAFFAGDRNGYRWWMAICRTLDRRMASAVGHRADR